MSKIETINFFSENYGCRSCFNNSQIRKNFQPFQLANIEGPQPRWIGKNYFESQKKICLMLINPGSGPNTPDHEWKPLKLLNQEKSENKKIDLWEQLMEVNKRGMPQWGYWESLYLDRFGFNEREKLNKICFMNKMLCAAWYRNKEGKLENAYNPRSLENCFKLQSSSLLKILSPKNLIFSGKETIASILKKPKELSMSEVNSSKDLSLKNFRKSLGPDSRELDPLDVKDEIRVCLDHDTRYFFMGHYGRSVSREDFNDVDIIRGQIGI